MANYSFFRIMASSPEVSPGNTDFCADSIKKEIDTAVSMEASLLLLPELCVTGASCGDMFLTDTLLSQASEHAEEIARYTEGKDIAVCFSLPVSMEGSVYSAAVLAAGGKMIGSVPLKKKDGSVFSEYRGERIVIRIGDEAVPFWRELRFRSVDGRWLSVSIDGSSSAAVDLIPDASYEFVDSTGKRREAVRAASALSEGVTVYCSVGEGESTASGVFCGHAVITEQGKILSEKLPFNEGTPSRMSTCRLLSIEDAEREPL